MFRHRGKARTFKQNFRLAAFLCFAAGLVNVCGVFALGVLTTNVTGHFAYFAEDVLQNGGSFGVYFLFYIVAFLTGSFVSSFLTEYFLLKSSKSPHNLSMFVEISVLLAMGLYGDELVSNGVDKRLLAMCLLFAMGLQNSLVSKISNSTVRTTHLTGLFTDLGIELSQLFFYKEKMQRGKLLHSIGLRVGIISFFFLGCVAGGFLFPVLKFKTLVIGAAVLFTALFYDNTMLMFYKVRKNLRSDVG